MRRVDSRLEASGREQVGQHLWANHAFKDCTLFHRGGDAGILAQKCDIRFLFEKNYWLRQSRRNERSGGVQKESRRVLRRTFKAADIDKSNLSPMKHPQRDKPFLEKGRRLRVVTNREKTKVKRNKSEHSLLNLPYLCSDYLTNSGIGRDVSEDQKIARQVNVLTLKFVKPDYDSPAPH